MEQLPGGHEALRVAIRLLEAKVTRRSTQKGPGQSSSPSWTSDAKVASILCEVALSRFQWLSSTQVSRAVDGEPELDQCSPSDRVRDVLLCDDLSGETAQFMTYLKQELSNTLLRLLKVTDLQDTVLRRFKALYCSLLTSWHAESGQVDALTALSTETRKLLEEAPGFS
eukprot:Skav216233  [mRNA]  locus=scaffold1994:9252:13075:+ [translate_table: standard]